MTGLDLERMAGLLEREERLSRGRGTRSEAKWRDARIELTHEAINALPSLIERVRELEGALKPFADMAAEIEDVARQHRCPPSEIGRRVRWSDCARAETVLAALKDTNNQEGGA